MSTIATLRIGAVIDTRMIAAGIGRLRGTLASLGGTLNRGLGGLGAFGAALGAGAVAGESFRTSLSIGRQMTGLAKATDLGGEGLEGLKQELFGLSTELKGVRLTRLGRRVYSQSVTPLKDPWGRQIFWIGGGDISWTGEPDSDFRAIDEGYVSITPLHLDLTHHKMRSEVASWALEGFSRHEG